MRILSSRALKFGAALGLLGSLVGASASAAAADSTPATTTLYVSSRGSDANSCTVDAPCATITHAVQMAAPGDTIEVGPGTYYEQLVITKKLTLESSGNSFPVIDAKNLSNGILVKGPGAAGSVIKGFVVENANFEGILLLGTNGITVSSNVVTGNDQGMFSKNPTGECAPQGKVPGDCGEGLHVMGTSGSTIINNLVTNNSGGILMTDEVGPTSNNLVKDNNVTRNLYDCGITLAAHSPKGFVNGKPNASVAGVFDNKIIGNTSTENGIKTGGGAGVLIAAAPPGGADYGNLVEANYLQGDGQAGVTMHSHTPNQYLANNQILDNFIHNTGTVGGGNLTPGDVDAGVHQTVGITVWSGVQPIAGTVIKGNILDDVHYGIWTKNITGSTISGNVFTQTVTVAKSAN